MDVDIETEIVADHKNSWGRSHLPPHDRGGNMLNTFAHSYLYFAFVYLRSLMYMFIDLYTLVYIIRL